MQSSEQWQDGRLLFERLQTLPNYEKCAWLCCTLLLSGFLTLTVELLTLGLCCAGGCARAHSYEQAGHHCATQKSLKSVFV